MNNQWRHYADISQCPLCPLKGQDYALSRIHRGTGKKVMFIGEAPGEEEAKQHLAFVGRSGKLLDKWIEYLGIDNYVITNVVRHRPPNNRRPTNSEIKVCYSYLDTEIVKENPHYIIALGRTAISTLGLIGDSQSITTALGKFYFTNEIKQTFAFYHPSYILRTGKDITKYLDQLKQRLEVV